ncbi:MAG: chromosome condensation regulator RCC1 [Myxococcota bacterium]|nr:chromosome condensation regulator RCC1 [Myxococcota bacterium]
MGAPSRDGSRFERLRPRSAGWWALVVVWAFVAGEAPADVATGLEHTCALSAPSTVECWGRNNRGQLGDGTLDDHALPAAVTGLAGLELVAVDAGEAFTCVQTLPGDLYCWGRNTEGQLGNGSTVSSSTPVAVVGLGGPVESFSTGRQHACAVLVGGTLKCWGDNVTGQLGDGTNSTRTSPVTISGIGGAVTVVASGFDHTCVVTASGSALCWGDNFFGQLGDGGAAPESNVPGAVSGLSQGVSGLAAGGFHTCARLAGGTMSCWGDNFYGQLGNATLTDHLVPEPVTGLGGAVASAHAGDSFTCARLVAGELQCWGENLDGQLGDGTTTDRSSPGTVGGLGGAVSQVDLGHFHACAKLATGAGFCWGDNTLGQLGDGSLSSASTPVQFLWPAAAVPLAFATRLVLSVALVLGGVRAVRRRGRDTREPVLSRD